MYAARVWHRSSSTAYAKIILLVAMITCAYAAEGYTRSVIDEGDGNNPKQGDSVTVHYTGKALRRSSIVLK